MLTTTDAAANKKIADDGGLGKTGIGLWAGILLLLLPGRIRYRWVAAAVTILVLSGSMLSLSSCGGTGGPPLTGSQPPPSSPPPPTSAPGTQTGSYSITLRLRAIHPRRRLRLLPFN